MSTTQHCDIRRDQRAKNCLYHTIFGLYDTVSGLYYTLLYNTHAHTHTHTHTHTQTHTPFWCIAGVRQVVVVHERVGEVAVVAHVVDHKEATRRAEDTPTPIVRCKQKRQQPRLRGHHQGNVKRDLVPRQKRPSTEAKQTSYRRHASADSAMLAEAAAAPSAWPSSMQRPRKKRPSTEAKETQYRGKRDLLKRIYLPVVCDEDNLFPERRHGGQHQRRL